MLMTQLKKQNPQAYSFINNAMHNGTDAEAMANKLLKDNNITGTRLDDFKKQLKSYGVPDNILNKLG